MKIAREINCNCIIVIEITLREKCLYLKFFWSLFFRIRIEFGNLQSSFLYSAQNAGKHRPGKLQIRRLFTRYKPNCLLSDQCQNVNIIYEVKST